MLITVADAGTVLSVPGAPVPFEIAVEQAVLDDLADRLRRTRFPADHANDDWGYGVNIGYLGRLVDYWVDGYDWRRQERAVNELPHYRTKLSGLPIHFVHQPWTGPNPLPIVLSHGWPWTFWDFRSVIGPLA